LAIIKKEASGLEQAETEIGELMRQRAVEEAHFLSYSKSLEQARIQENLGAGKITNIGEVQAPSFPTRSRAAIKKMMIQLAGAGVAIGLALALGLELFLNQSIKRPQEVETRLRLPLFFWLPAIKNGNGLLPAPHRDGDVRPDGAREGWNGLGTLKPYFEAMRDRLIHYFEARNLTHKPKLVAVTSCGKGAGVSSVAKGLALSLSEAGDGNILLVDMTNDHGTAHSFFKSDACTGLTEALALETRQSAQIQDKLYIAKTSELSGDLQNAIPRRFTHLVPKMKASDYDFIIFDLPPVSATSITARLAGFMDLVLEVAESEKTNRDTAKRVASVLGEVQPNVSVVLNKCQNRLPAWLHQEF
jgi:polysaccharide biosynthesis transport protein